MEKLKMARPVVPAYSADGSMRFIDGRTLEALHADGQIAHMVTRKRDKVVTRVYLKARPNEIASRITAQAEVVKVLPTTWTHRLSLMAGL